MSSGFAAAPAAIATVEIFDGRRQPYGGTEPLLVTAIDGSSKTISRDFHRNPSVRFDLPFHDNLQDQYTFIAWAKGYKQAGFTPVHVSDKTEQRVKLMLLPESNSLNFAGAKWNIVKAARPKLAAVLAAGAADEAAAGARYSDLEDEAGGQALACLLNITAVMAKIFLPSGTPLDYLRMVNWELQGNFRLAQDRFFGWADPAIIHQLDLAKAQGTFVDAPAGLHPGATRSYKQIQFGEANLQLTFHEGDTKEIGGTTCVRIEPDIDYFKDTAAHLLFEVLVNAFGSLTDPRTVYVLRWIAGQHAGIP
ncbi:MAG: hypothetical protein ABUS51_10065, partial [Acidobacteriota bacterium]